MAELTKEYFEAQLKNLATTDDLKTLATKDDITAVNQRIDGVEKRIDRLPTHADLDQRFNHLLANIYTKEEIDQKFAELPTKADFNQLLVSMDALTKAYTTSNDEVSVSGHRLDKVEGWIRQASKKIGIAFKQ